MSKRIVFINYLDTILSYFRNDNTASRVYQFQDRSGTIAHVDIEEGTYATELNFKVDQDIFKDATGLSITFTLGSDNANGVGIVLRLNKPTAVTFPGNFEAHPNSATLDATKMNVYTLVYFSSWNGSNTPRVIYINSLYTAV